MKNWKNYPVHLCKMSLNTDTTLNNVKIEITCLERNLPNHTEEDQFAEIKQAITTNQEMHHQTN